MHKQSLVCACYLLHFLLTNKYFGCKRAEPIPYYTTTKTYFKINRNNSSYITFKYYIKLKIKMCISNVIIK